MAAGGRAQSSNEPPHPILGISGSGSGASTILSTWTEAQYTNNFIPHQSPRNNDYGFAPAVVAGDSGWSWSSSTPNQIISTPSGTIFPTTPSYVIQTQAVTVLSGNTVRVPYYNKAGSSAKSLVFALIDYNKLQQLRSDFNKLAPAYVNSGSGPTTRNDAYAQRIAIALLDWARWFPDYYMTDKNNANFINVTPSYILPTDEQRASDHNGLAHEWQDDELKAFDAIYDSVALTNLSNQYGFDVRAYIKNNLFCNEGDFIEYHVPVDVAIQSNLSGPYTTLAEVARVLNRPDYILWMDQYLDATVRQKIRRDGVLEEGLGYSIGYINENLSGAQGTRDYFLTRLADTPALVGVSNRAGSYVATLSYGQGQWNLASLPTGQLPSFGDTPFNNYFSSHSSGNSTLLPAYGHVAMGAGSGSQAVQVNQNFPGNNNHMRSDTTAFVLWAFNNEYLGNIRYYNGTPGRQFDEQILSHNAVTIDRVNETPYPDADTYGNGDLTLYEPGNNGLAMTELDGQRAYSGKASRYQRLLFLNSADLSRPYLVDVFRVTGGTNHDYTLHGAIRWDQTWECSFPLATNASPYPMLEGETWVEPTSSGSSFPYYGFWRNVNSNQAPGNFQITYRDANRSSGRDVRLWMTDDGTAKVYVGMTPNPGRDNTVPANFYVYWRPSTIIRKRITSGTLQDLFVSVIEPMNTGTSTIQSVDRLPVNGSNLESCALKITFTDGRVDTYLVNLHNPQVAGANGGSATVSTADGKYSLAGRVGVHMDRTGGDARVWTVNATDFQYPGRRLSTPGAYYSGLISGETRKLTGGSNDAFITSAALPTGTALRNKFLSLTHGALSGSGTMGISEMFKVDQVIFSNSQYYVCFTNDHMLEITNGTTSVEQMAPLRTFTGSNSFEIALSASAGQISPLADLSLAPGGSSGPVSFNFGNLGSSAGASLQVLASSSNPALVPNTGLVIGGSGTNRTINVTATSGTTGSSLITVSVTDGAWTNSRSFTVLVNSFAVAATPASQTVLAGNGTNYTVSIMATNGFSDVVTFGVSGLPTGANGSFNPPSISGAGSTTLNVTTASNTPPGNFALTITAAGSSVSSTTAVSLAVTIITAPPGTMVWNVGSSPANTNWSTASNWTNTTAGGFGPPGISNDVVFGGAGVVGGSNGVDNVVDSDTTISSLTFANTNGFHTTQIAPGKTLTVLGAKGVVVGTETDLGTNATVYAGMTGSGGTLAVSNASANVLVRQFTAGASGGIQRATLDLSGLDTFNATASGIQVGIYTTNGTGRSAGSLYLARTNFLNLLAQSKTSTTNAGIDVADNPLANSSMFSYLFLGQVNTIYADGITVGGGRNIGWMGFDPAFTNSSAYIRGTNGAASRVTRWSVGDNSGANNTGSNSRGTNDFSGGTVDALVDLMILGRGESPSMGSGSSTGMVTFAQGTINVNNLQLGVQTPGSTGGTTAGTPGTNYFGAMNVNGAGTLVVNSNLVLGSQAGGSGAYSLQGTLNINGGTVQAINVTNGGGTAVVAINSGTLDLQPAWAGAAGKVANVTTLSVGASGVTVRALLTGAATLSTPNPMVIASNGVLAGNTFITTPQLLVNGAVSPGTNSVGVMTNSGTITFGAGGRYGLDIADAVGSPGVTWDLLGAGGSLDVQATSPSPFTIQVQSVENPVQGLPDFDNNAAYTWVIATANGGVSGFAPSKFTVDNTAFADDLAGGYFFVSASGASLNLNFTNNHPPVVSDAIYRYAPGSMLQIPIASLAPHWSDPDGDPVSFVGVQTSSGNGANVSADALYIYYTSTNSGADTITYTVADVRTNPPAVYRVGDTIRTGSGLVQVLPLPVINAITLAGGNVALGGTNGTPGAAYYVLSSSNASSPLANWTRVATNVVDVSGNFGYTNALSSGAAQQFYRLQFP